MNQEMYILIDFLVNKFKEHPLTNTVVFGLSQLGDVNKTNIYPLVHIIPSNITPGNNFFVCSFEIAVLNRRDSNQKLNVDKIFSDNLIDNLSETAKIFGFLVFEDNESRFESLVIIAFGATSNNIYLL